MPDNYRRRQNLQSNLSRIVSLAPLHREIGKEPVAKTLTRLALVAPSPLKCASPRK